MPATQRPSAISSNFPVHTRPLFQALQVVLCVLLQVNTLAHDALMIPPPPQFQCLIAECCIDAKFISFLQYQVRPTYFMKTQFAIMDVRKFFS